MYNHTNEISIIWTKSCVLCVSIKGGIVHGPKWSFNDQFNQVIHNWYVIKWTISIIEKNIYDLPQENDYKTQKLFICLLHKSWLLIFFFFGIIHLFLRTVLEIFDISTLRVSLWLLEHHTFQYKVVFPFSESNTSMCDRLLQLIISFSFWDLHLVTSNAKT